VTGGGVLDEFDYCSYVIAFTSSCLVGMSGRRLLPRQLRVTDLAAQDLESAIGPGGTGEL